MKIKFKQSIIPTVSNIQFAVKYPKKRFNSSKSKTTALQNGWLYNNQSSFCQNESMRRLGREKQIQNDFHSLKCKGFIPRNPNLRGDLFFCTQKGIKPIKSLQTAKQLERRFPVRRALSKKLTVGQFRRKDRIFQFININPEVQSQIFTNKQISKSMVKSQSLFYPKKDSDQISKNNVMKKTSTSFHRCSMFDSTGISPKKLAYKVIQFKGENFQLLNKINDLNF